MNQETRISNLSSFSFQPERMKPIDICKQTKEMFRMSMSALDQCHTVTPGHCVTVFSVTLERRCNINTVNTLSHTSMGLLPRIGQSHTPLAPLPVIVQIYIFVFFTSDQRKYKHVDSRKSQHCLNESAVISLGGKASFENKLFCF